MQSMLFLYIPRVGLLQYPNHPETAIQQVQLTLYSEKKKEELNFCHNPNFLIPVLHPEFLDF